MAQVLCLTSGNAAAGFASALTGTLGMSFDEGDPDHWALEYDVYYGSPGSSLGAYFASSTVSSWNIHLLSDAQRADQFGFTARNAVLPLMWNRWMKRVIRPNPAAGGVFAKLGISANSIGSEFWEAICFANIKVTYARQTKLWLWREGMPALSVASSSGFFGAPSFSVIDFPGGALPDYCSKGESVGLDDIRNDRVSGGRLASTMFWDRKRESFGLTDIVVTPEQRNEMDALYDVFRRESMLYRHAAGYPPSRVRFERPPKFRDSITESGTGKFDMELRLLEV